MASSDGPCPPPEALEAVALGAPVGREIDAHVVACAVCREEVQRIQADNRFLERFAVAGRLPRVAADNDAPALDIPGYELLGEIHRGGQGVVYHARQRSTKRDVAIKVMRHGPFATLADRARFDREIETLGKLNHPNIVAVHDAGVVAGFHYFVMNYVDGRTLDDAFHEMTAGADDLAAAHATALSVFIRVCDAVHAAHLRGVIHRDLKPSNIRVDSSGQPHVLDFGLAKSLEASDESAMTRTGQFVGSLPWASPEQIEGASSRIDLRSDVYSLGAILFQLLTGRLPFDVGSNLRDALDDILYRLPPRPSAVVSATRGLRLDDELDTIVLKCLSKDPQRRYQTAGELARDLRHYLAGEAIEAKRDSALYVLRKTMRRYRLHAAAAAAFVVLLVVFAVVMALLYRRSARLEQAAVSAAATLSDLLGQSSIEQGRMAAMLGNLEQAEHLLWRELLVRRTTAAGAAAEMHDPPGPPEAFWALWETYRRLPCRRSMPFPSKALTAIGVAEDGRDLWLLDEGGMVRRITATGASVDSYRLGSDDPGWLTAISRNGACVVTHRGNENILWRRDAADRPLFQFEMPSFSDGSSISIAPSGERVALALDGAAVVASTAPFREIARFAGVEGRLLAVAISHDQSRLAARDASGSLFVWEIDSGALVRRSAPSDARREVQHEAGGLLFSPDGHRLADAWWQGPGRIWDLRPDPPRAIELRENPSVYRVQDFSPDGQTLAVGDNAGVLRLFDVHTGERRAAFVAHPRRIRGVAFSGDGQRLWTCGDDLLRQWELTTEAGTRVIRVEGESFHGVAFSPDGRWVVSVGGSGTLHRVDCATGAIARTNIAPGTTLSSVAVSPDGDELCVASYANQALLLDAQDPTHVIRTLHHPHRVSVACYADDGATIATACDDGIVRLWRAASGQLARELPSAGSRMPQITFHPSGRWIAGAVRNGALLVWDLRSLHVANWLPESKVIMRAVRYSPDGAWLYAAGSGRTVDVWDARTGRCVAALVGHNQEIYCLDTSRDDDLLVSGDAGGTIRLWHGPSRRALAVLDGHAGAVMDVCFSPDGRRLASAALDGTLRIWDLRYYERHIAGNLDAQVQMLLTETMDEEMVAAWRRWAAQLAPAEAP